MRDFFLSEIKSETAFEIVSRLPINRITICSVDGDLGVMLGLYDTFRLSGVDTRALGYLKTVAAVLFQAGYKRTMTQNSLLVFVEPPQNGEGNFSDADWYMHNKLVNLIQQRTGMHLIEVHDLFDGKPINAERALELGLCDEIEREK